MQGLGRRVEEFQGLLGAWGSAALERTLHCNCKDTPPTNSSNHRRNLKGIHVYSLEQPTQEQTLKWKTGCN